MVTTSWCYTLKSIGLPKHITPRLPQLSACLILVMCRSLTFTSAHLRVRAHIEEATSRSPDRTTSTCSPSLSWPRCPCAHRTCPCRKHSAVSGDSRAEHGLVRRPSGKTHRWRWGALNARDTMVSHVHARQPAPNVLPPREPGQAPTPGFLHVRHDTRNDGAEKSKKYTLERPHSPLNAEHHCQQKQIGIRANIQRSRKLNKSQLNKADTTITRQKTNHTTQAPK